LMEQLLDQQKLRTSTDGCATVLTAQALPRCATPLQPPNDLLPIPDDFHSIGCLPLPESGEIVEQSTPTPPVAVGTPSLRPKRIKTRQFNPCYLAFKGAPTRKTKYHLSLCEVVDPSWQFVTPEQVNFYRMKPADCQCLQ